MEKPTNIIYKTVVSAIDGRVGRVKSLDGKFDLKLSKPAELGGDDGNGTNPEQLFASAYAACFIGAIEFVATRDKIDLPKNIEVSAEVGIGPIKCGFNLDVDIYVSIPETESSIVNALVKGAHEACPYSNATRDNIDVRITIK